MKQEETKNNKQTYDARQFYSWPLIFALVVLAVVLMATQTYKIA